MGWRHAEDGTEFGPQIAQISLKQSQKELGSVQSVQSVVMCVWNGISKPALWCLWNAGNRQRGAIRSVDVYGTANLRARTGNGLRLGGGEPFYGTMLVPWWYHRMARN
jgi:hypothetical protein